ncbi:MAG: protein kinase [Nevskiaceae bacterium]|nr:protein kinase [Nevskiaceae bacterium]
MHSPLRLLIVSSDKSFGQWLQHHIEALRNDVIVDTETLADFEYRLATQGAATFDLVMPLLSFAVDANQLNGIEWLTRLRDFPGSPPMIVIAEGGDERTAVQTLRLGVLDYLPRHLLTPELLSASLETCLDEVRGVQHMRAPAVWPLSAPRDLIPRYTLLEVLGESKRATVYLAHSAALNHNVALKVSQMIENEQPQFSREYAAIGALNHPSVVDIYDYGVHEGREYIAMEYFPCGDLKARLQNPISELESIHYLHRIASALAVVHAAGIIHRDLKPPNIMLREDGSVVLIDFGLARSLDGGARSTVAGLLRGSPYYMSPEQAQGMDLDERSDLYSLGVILYEMLTGFKPYTGASAVEVLQHHVNAPVPSLPAELARYQGILDRLMAKSRDDRFSSANEVLAALTLAAA